MTAENAFARVIAAAKLYSHLNNLPPTYTMGEKGGYMQLVPDPTTPQMVQYHLDHIKRAEADLAKLNAKK